jgi:hypothetical protein
MRKYQKPEWEGTFEVRGVDCDEADSLYRVHFGVYLKGQKKRYNNRWYGAEIDAKRGAAQLYRHYIRIFEQEVLGQ